MKPNRGANKFATIALLLSSFFPACGPAGSGAGGVTSVVTDKGALAAGHSALRIRWFPVEGAKGYVLYVGGAALRVPDTVCRPSSVSFTTGLCSYELVAPDGAAGTISVSAINERGEGPRAAAILPFSPDRR